MRIWYQSSMPFDKDPVWKPYEESLKKHIQSISSTDTIVDIHGLNIFTPALDRSDYVEYLNTGQWIYNARLAEDKGYDGIAGGCMLDTGLSEIKEIVNIPAVFAAETCFHIACMMSKKFALLAHNKAVVLRMEELVKRYGLWERFIPSDCFSISMDELREGFNKPEPVIKAVREAAGKAMEKGAGILVCSCNILNMVLVDSGTNEVDGIPILDSVGTVLKAAEFFIALNKVGISRGRRGLYSGLLPEELDQIRKLYGVD